MFRRTYGLWITIHSPRAVPFVLGAAEAKTHALAKYQSRWLFGAHSEFLELQAPQPEFIPFYLCNGTVRTSFVGRVQYNQSTKGNNTSSSHWTRTSLLSLETSFHENTTQLYGGYKYNNRHIHSALRNDANALKMQKVAHVDLSVGSIGLFEMSTKTMRSLVGDIVKEQVRALCEKQVRTYHKGASSIQIDFKTFDFVIEDVYPTFLPCYVINAQYDGQEHRLYVCGATGRVGAPYLINALLVGRVACLATLFSILGLSVNKAVGFLTGSFAGVAAYYAAFYAAKYFPVYLRNYFRDQRERQRVANIGEDASGFKPSSASQRITEEYHRSTYWDSHTYQQRKSAQDKGPKGSSTSSSSAGDAHSAVADPKGYYRVMGVPHNASVNEIRSAFRQRVMMHHPDAGGSTETMALLNEAYRTLRDPKLREQYDRAR